jgi:hypothetical protein
MNVYENVLPKLLLSKIQQEVFGNNQLWSYSATTLETSDNLYGYSWAHKALDATGNKSQLFDILQAGILVALESGNQTINELYRIRLGLTTVTHQRFINQPHIDMERPHKTGLLYLNNADGATVFYENMYHPSSRLDAPSFYEKFVQQNLKVSTEVEPVENRLVVFDGYQYHSSSTPTTVPRRVVLNFNFI